MTDIILWGARGKMGQAISRLAQNSDDVRIVAQVDKGIRPKQLYELGGKGVVVVDFSCPQAFDEVTQFCMSKGLALVMGTTGLSQGQLNMLSDMSKSIPIFYAANMSAGVLLLKQLAQQAARILSDFDVEIVEAHHNQKVDAPSGTALELFEAIKQERADAQAVFSRSGNRQKNEVGIHSLRGGSVVGVHEIRFFGQGECITLTHEALSKDIFALGALRAAVFLSHKKEGLYKKSTF